jgi:hypothetical protein
MRAGEACQRALAFYLAEMEARRLHQALGFPSTVHFAIHRLGISAGRARDLLRAGRRLEQLAELDAAFARGELSWSKVRRIARVASPENQARWIERCRALTAEQVEAITAKAQEGDDPPSLEKGLPQANFVLRFHVAALEREMFEQARAKLAAETGRVITDAELLGELLRLFLASQADGTVPGRKRVDASLFRVVVRAGSGGERSDASAAALAECGPVVVDDEQLRWVQDDVDLPQALRRRALERDGHRCRHCGSGRSPMVHHIQRRKDGGDHHPTNLLTLCAHCHGLVHAGYLCITTSPRGPVFTDRTGEGLRGPLPCRQVLVRKDGGEGSAVALRGASEVTATAAESSHVPEYLEPHEVPAVATVEWWREHEHCFEWSRDGRTLHLRRPRADGRRRRA